MLSGTKAFALICFGQAMSILGSGLTSFAISVWVYEHSRMTTPFALLGMLSFLPGALILPYSGVIADRHNRRNIMLWCNLGGGTAIFLVAFLQSGNLLHIWTLCIIASFMPATIEISLQAIFEAPTVAELAERVRTARSSQPKPSIPLVKLRRKTVSGPLP